MGQNPQLRSKTGGYSRATQENSGYSRTDQTARGADSPLSGKELWKNENFLLFRIVSDERSINSHGYAYSCSTRVKLTFQTNNKTKYIQLEVYLLNDQAYLLVRSGGLLYRTKQKCMHVIKRLGIAIYIFATDKF